MRYIAALLLLLLGATAAHAQATVEQCVRATPTGPCNAISATNPLPVTGGGGGATTANQGTAGTNAQAWWVQIGNGTVGPATVSAQGVDGLAGTNLLGVYNQNMLYGGTTLSLQRDIAGASLATGFGVAATGIVPSSSANNATTGAQTGAAANSLVLKASAGNLFSVYATNLTATAGFLVVLNATTAPADGAITPLECVPLPANGNASISYNPGPAKRFSTGITAVVTSAATCFTKTTGTLTAFIKGEAL